MRRKMCALMMIPFLLTGCSMGAGNGISAAEELALTIRTEYLAMTVCSATIEVTADYGQRVYTYTLSMDWEKNGETVLTVVAPETIAGITARVENGTGYLEYDGAGLETGPLLAGGLSPVEAVPLIVDYICSGYIAECDLETVGEKRQLWLCCRDPETASGMGMEAAFWFDEQSHTLLRAELISDGYTVIQCHFTDFIKA